MAEIISEKTENGKKVYTVEVDAVCKEEKVVKVDELLARKAKLEPRLIQQTEAVEKTTAELEEINTLLGLIDDNG